MDPRYTDEGRAERLGQLFERGLAAAAAAYAAGTYPEDYGTHNVDRIIVGSPLTLAHALLRRGDGADMATVARILGELLDLQERRPDHPHRGNWPRFMGDDHIEDLNSAPFVCRWFIPLLADHGEALPPALRERCRDGLRRALEELERLDVSLNYSNIHLMSLFALIAGGELLGDRRLAGVGKRRWARWLEFTTASGAPREYNSATYMGMNLTVLAKMQAYCRDRQVVRQARLLYERFWLHAAVHIHRPTGQLAGPHARCYWGAMISGRERLLEVIWRETGWDWILAHGPYQAADDYAPRSLELALTPFWLPGFVAAWLQPWSQGEGFTVRETASVAEGYDLSTRLTRDYALGVASTTYSTGTGVRAIEEMANHFMLHYTTPAAASGWGLAYSRFVVNNQHLGTLGSFSFRPSTNFFDQGNFAGVEDRGRAICHYSLAPTGDIEVESLKTVVAFQSGRAVEAIWSGDRRIGWEDLPCAVDEKDWLIVAHGSVFVGVRPLDFTHLDATGDVRLEIGPKGELWLSIYNYRGPAKRFWDLASLGGAYWRGNIRAGFVVEVGEISRYRSAARFHAALRRSRIRQNVRGRVHEIAFARGGRRLELAYDLWNTRPLSRAIDGVAYVAPNLESPLGVQGGEGMLAVAGATLRSNRQQMWLIGADRGAGWRGWIAANPSAAETPLELATPLGTIRAASFGQGRLVLSAGARPTLLLDTQRPPAGLSVPEGIRVVTARSEGRSPGSGKRPARTR